MNRTKVLASVLALLRQCRMRAPGRRCIAAALLLMLLSHLLPFTLQSPSVGAGRGKGFKHYFEPLQVCDTGSGLGGVFADHAWLPAPIAGASDLQLVADYPPAPPPVLPERPPRRLLRPPRA